jgi:outer membrane protein OmpA-like peptidoglycan-associated protein
MIKIIIFVFLFLPKITSSQIHNLVLNSALEDGINSHRLQDTTVMNLIGERLVHSKLHRIRIIGYTDSTGSDSANQALSLRRAQTIADLISLKYAVPGSRVTAIGGGISRKYDSSAKNRRVEVIFY